MKRTQFRIGELMLAVIFFGIFSASVAEARTWEGFYFIPMSLAFGFLLFFVFCVIVLMMRQHRERR
jgi:hypothetical protein